MVKQILEAIGFSKENKFLRKNEEVIWISGFKGAEKYLEGCHIYNHEMINVEDYRIYASLNSAYDHCDPVLKDMGYFVVRALIRKTDWDEMKRNRIEKRDISYVAKEIFFEYQVAYNDRWIKEWIKSSKYGKLPENVIRKIATPEFARVFLN